MTKATRITNGPQSGAVIHIHDHSITLVNLSVRNVRNKAKAKLDAIALIADFIFIRIVMKFNKHFSIFLLGILKEIKQ